MTSQNLQNQKQDTLQNKYTGTVLTPSEIDSLREDLKQTHTQSKGHFKHRAERLSGRIPQSNQLESLTQSEQKSLRDGLKQAAEEVLATK